MLLATIFVLKKTAQQKERSWCRV